jgi:hypothetical protein
MTKLIEYAGYEPVKAKASIGCDGCAFKGLPLWNATGEYTDCGKVACFGDEFPREHPLRKAKNINWVRKEPV